MEEDDSPIVGMAWQPFVQGAIVEVICHRGARRILRVWEDSNGPGVLLCSEAEYKRALATGREPLAVGYPKQDIAQATEGSA